MKKTTEKNEITGSQLFNKKKKITKKNKSKKKHKRNQKCIFSCTLREREEVLKICGSD